MTTQLEIKDKTAPIDSIKISPFRKNIRKTTPHKHNSYFEIIFLTEGSGTHTTDTQKFDIVPPIVFTVRKEQIHFWNIETEPSGYVLIIKKQYIDDCLDKEIKQLLSKLSAYPCLYPNAQSLEPLFEILNQEYQENGYSQKPVVDGLLKAILGKLLLSAKAEKASESNKVSDFQHFKELLNQENQLTNKVAHYAKLLHTTPQNLNAICRKEANQSATEIISEHIISEAKRLLLYTDLTVNEISHKLDFKDNSHFTKYFKRHTELTPNAFRKELLWTYWD